LLYELIDGEEHFAAPPCRDPHTQLPNQHERGRVAQVHSTSPSFDRIVDQAAADMMALRLHVPNTEGDPIPAGGVPWFLSLFGRDAIIASLQFLVANPELSRGALDRLGSLQADRVDDFRDGEPGKIPHELRQGELAFFRKIPYTPYYGTADATPLYLILLHAAWKSMGDDTLLHRHLGTAERCLDWIDQYGDRDGDGFQEYQTRSSAGLTNHGWKDASDAVLYPDGSLVKEPRALCELQGYVFDAWLRMAEIFSALGDARRAAELRCKAGTLYHRFNEAFWDEEAGFYALALDGNKQKVMTIASNPGHCLWSGIVPPERARRLVHRLLQPDMWSGWGIRTLSSAHCAYNPFSYQNGSVWPHDNSIIAMGFKRYGFAKEAATVSRAICDAASYFMSDRLPELFAGVDRAEIGLPLRYLGSNVPQAWAAGAIFAIVQALIGYATDAPAHRLYLEPILPDWLPRLDVHNLHIGKNCIALRFWRDGEATCFEVQGNSAGLVVQRAPASDGLPSILETSDGV
jgi:glycogen debranching enzyme